ncbi:glycoside hydrolase family 2 TIM barrel-domain containing protein [Allosphingosinicella deserti]|uniref:Glycoside hydrolase family 2 n=1 Tax=Allosphingosinicella deserti TaxID=2116704 RepID=A0A2P7QLC4_9SPHN|nr:glycoside hydrolase family 2 TIM barrel-domain containing protein [Sphingomonas deserti]PSJ38771.1 glycoside hydrolase family 2 [Sphingomonas deserti]
MLARRAVMVLAALIGAGAQAAARDVVELDGGWRFFQGDPERAEAVDFDASGWSRVSIPHDWQIAGPIREDAAAGGAGGYFPTGIAWYRRDLDVRPAPGRRWFVELDGVMERGGVWVNGHHVGYRPYGYVSARYEITQLLKAEGRNVLAVRADTSHAPSSRWYAGGGLYRKVRLISTGAATIPLGGVFVTTPEISADAATVRIETEVEHARGTPAAPVRLEAILIGPNGREAARTTSEPVALAEGRTATLRTEVKIARPRLWDLDRPDLYRARLRVLGADGAALDSQEVPFGVRKAEFRADSGFWLNGRNVKLKGVAVHEDGGAVGMAVPLAVWRQRLTRLKAMGVNAIRTAHNPPAPGFLDLTDELGLVVMDEAFDQWNVAKNPGDYHLFFGDWHVQDAHDIVARDRNHPSIVLWSAGNEIHDTAFPVQAKAALKSLLDVIHRTDPSRPVTQGLFRPNVTGDYANGLADMLDVVGQNYRETELIQAHKDDPTRIIVGTENSHARTSWLAVRDFKPYSGMFLWTGVDYLGEADRRGWPNIDNPAGLLDRTGAPRIRGLERESWWSETPVIHVVRNAAPEAPPAPNDGAGPTLPMPVTVAVATPAARPQIFADWTPSDLSPHPETIEVYSNCPSVRVTLNGRDLGIQTLPADAAPRRWPVTFAPGTVTASCIGSKAKATLRTAGAPARVVLEPETKQVGSDFDDLAFVRARIADAKGVTVPGSALLLTFSVEGAGRLVAVDNASSVDHTPFTSPTRAALDGNAVALVRGAGAGQMRIRVEAPGLKGDVVELESRP